MRSLITAAVINQIMTTIIPDRNVKALFAVLRTMCAAHDRVIGSNQYVMDNGFFIMVKQFSLGGKYLNSETHQNANDLLRKIIPIQLAIWRPKYISIIWCRRKATRMKMWKIT